MRMTHVNGQISQFFSSFFSASVKANVVAIPPIRQSSTTAQAVLANSVRYGAVKCLWRLCTPTQVLMEMRWMMA